MPHTRLRPLPDDLDRITNLAIDLKLAPHDWPWAAGYLDRVLLGGAMLGRHLAHLEKLYQAEFRRFPSRRDRTPEQVAVPGGPNVRFRYRDLLPEDQALAIVERGPDALCDRAVFQEEKDVQAARLLLNPYALWDLADLIDALLPDYWLDQMTAHAPEVGIDLSDATPLIEEDALTQEEERHPEAAFASRRKATQQPKSVGQNKWEIELPAWAKRKLAAVAFGAAERPFALFLHRIPRGADAAEAEVELRPAPTKADVTLAFRFRTGDERAFALEVPDDTKDDPTVEVESIRSNPCPALPGEAFRLDSLDSEPLGDWFRVVFRSCAWQSTWLAHDIAVEGRE
jgi:hypothetical protein